MFKRLSRDDLNRRWLRKWLRGEPHFVIGSLDDPYLFRWFIVPRNRLCNVYLHKFMRSDDDRALHDHPWPFWSWIVKGDYIEHTPTRYPVGFTRIRTRARWSFGYRPANWMHRVQLLPDGSGGEIPAWTVIVTGPKVREWGFACAGGWRHWRDFDERGCE